MQKLKHNNIHRTNMQEVQPYMVFIVTVNITIMMNLLEVNKL